MATPHCEICTDELKLEDAVVVTEVYGIIHLYCNHLNFFGEIDRGKLSEVISRNKHFKDLSKLYSSK